MHEITTKLKEGINSKKKETRKGKRSCPKTPAPNKAMNVRMHRTHLKR